jgi:nicotinate-nucleotide adenylyltransferase
VERVTGCRLGVLGGTFDPIHHGHLVAAQEACYQLALDCVLFVPAGEPPHKSRHPSAAAHHRVRMVELSIAGRPHFRLSRVDIDRPGPHYTADMLELLRDEWGEATALFFIEGTGSLAEILSWHDPQRILDAAELAVVDRPGCRVDLGALAAELPGLAERVQFVEMPALEISSTDIRNRVRDRRPIAYLLPRAVEVYIGEHGLYREA